MKYVWLVGASSGIGEALARQLSGQNTMVFISARNKTKLAEMAELSSDSLIPVALDICDDWSVAAAVKQIRVHTTSLDQVIINAGTCEYIDSDEIDVGVVKDVMETNFFGALSVVNAALPMLRAKNELSATQPKQAQLAFMSSSVTYQALPRAGAYGASKAALRYFAECLRLDLQHEGIDVRVISPGFVKTPLTDKNDFPMPFRISAEQAAQRIEQGLNANKFDISFPRRFTSLLKLVSFLPDSVRFKLLGKSSRHAGHGTPNNKSSV
jgi:short-subunit dehydrogenase